MQEDWGNERDSPVHDSGTGSQPDSIVGTPP